VQYLRASRRRKHVLNGRGGRQVIERVPQGLLLPLQPRRRVLQLQQRLLLSRRALECAPDEERKRRRKEVPAKVLCLLLRLPTEPVREPNHVLHVPLHLARQRLQILFPVAGRPVLQPSHLGDQVGLGPHQISHSEPFLALADEEEPVVDEALVLHHLPDAADVRGARNGVGVDNAEPEIGLEERVHHHPVSELEDLEREDRAGEEHEREREERELHHVVRLGWIRVVLLRERRGRAPKQGAAFSSQRTAFRREQYRVWV
jgi:hypothetical protein